MNPSHLTLLNQARQNASQGDAEKAMGLLKKLLEISRNDKEVQATAYFEIGKIYTKINKDDAAVKFLKKAISIAPEVLIQEIDWFQDLKRRNKKHIFDELERAQAGFKEYLMEVTKDAKKRPAEHHTSSQEKIPELSPVQYVADEPELSSQQAVLSHSGTFRVAGFWKRVIATLVDSLLQIFVAAILLIILRYAFGFTGIFLLELDVFVMWYAILILSMWLYYAIMESSRCQGTVGKMLIGIYITDRNGRRIGIGKATGRYFLKSLLYSVPLLGLIDCVMVPFTENKQAWHDMPVGCLVLSKQ